MDGYQCNNELFMLETTTMKWYQIAQTAPPLPRHKHGACINGNQVFTFGGLQEPPCGFGDLYVLHLLSTKEQPTLATNPPLHKQTSGTSHDEVTQLKQENFKLREELQSCYSRLGGLAKPLDQCTVQDLEEIERYCFTTLYKISQMKKDKIVEYEKQLRDQAELKQTKDTRDSAPAPELHKPRKAIVEYMDTDKDKATKPLVTFGNVTTRIIDDVNENVEPLTLYEKVPIFRLITVIEKRN